MTRKLAHGEDRGPAPQLDAARRGVDQQNGWKVVDLTILGVGGQSMLTDIHTEQIIPIMKQGGWAKLLELMHTRLAQIKKT